MSSLQLGHGTSVLYNLTPLEKFRIDVQEGRVKLTKSEIERGKTEAEEFIRKICIHP